MTIKNLGYGSWLPYDESSDSPSDRKGGYKEKSDNLSSNYGMLFENNRKEAALTKLRDLQKIIEAARKATKRFTNKEKLFINMNKHNRNIPYGVVVILQKYSNKECKVEYQGQESTTKRIFLKKIWQI